MFRIAIIFIAVAIAGVGLQACGVRPKAEESCNFVQNSDQRRVSWSSQAPVVIYIDETTVHNSYFQAIQNAAAVWNKALGRDVIKIGGIIKHDKSSVPDGVNLLYFQTDWDGDSIEQARTTIWWAGDRIYESDVKVNDRDFAYFTGDAAEAGKVDLESLIIHEFGHVLGLKHVELPQSVMVPTLASATNANPDIAFRRNLSADDMKSITCEY